MGFIDNFFNTMMKQAGTKMNQIERNAKTSEDIAKAREMRLRYEDLKSRQAEREREKWEGSQSESSGYCSDTSQNHAASSYDSGYYKTDGNANKSARADDQEIEHVSYIAIDGINYYKRENGFIFFSCVKCGEKMKTKMQDEGRRLFNCPVCSKEYAVKGEKIFRAE